jgi:hypothetical protein
VVGLPGIPVTEHRGPLCPANLHDLLCSP